MINSREFYNNRFSSNWLPTQNELIRVHKIINFVWKNKRVLDIGCYDGTIAKLIQENDNELYGCDTSKNAIKLALQKGFKADYANVEEKLPYGRSFFDVVIAGEIIEHVFDTDKFLENIKRVLKQDGHLVLSTPNLATVGRRILLFFGKNPLIETSTSYGDKASGHIRYFVKDSLMKLLKEHEFRIKKLTSDMINFDNSGEHYSIILANIFPTLGKTLIVDCIRR